VTTFAAVAAQVRRGEWTTYGDISTAARGDSRWARAVGREAANSADFPTAHRVLGHGGMVTRGSEGAEIDRARARLEAEGVRFTSGRADPARRVHWDELARRVGVTPTRGNAFVDAEDAQE
jgi:alkylated DNA nucleotide flippase Atl1